MPIIAIAKGKNRNAGDETFFHEGKVIKFKKNDPTLFFLQRLRDEAHRFAISAHRIKRRKGLSKSLLDQISGIGKNRKRALLNHFGSAKLVESASFEELKSVDGIEEKVAKKIEAPGLHITQKSKITDTFITRKIKHHNCSSPCIHCSID